MADAAAEGERGRGGFGRGRGRGYLLSKNIIYTLKINNITSDAETVRRVVVEEEEEDEVAVRRETRKNGFL